MSTWKFKTNHVEESLNTTDFVSSESIVLCYIPNPDGKTDVGENLTTPSRWAPIGLVENLSIQQRRQLNELFEIGSKKQYQIPGRTFRRLNISRVLFNGQSLLRVMTKGSNRDIPTDDHDRPGIPTSKLFINLASSFFDRPCNLGILIQDQNVDDSDGTGTEYGAVALHNCYIETHNLSLSAQQTVVMEAVSVSFNDVVPVEYGTGVSLEDSEEASEGETA